MRMTQATIFSVSMVKLYNEHREMDPWSVGYVEARKRAEQESTGECVFLRDFTDYAVQSIRFDM